MTGARPSVGSSSSKSRAPVRRMRAIASICCSPPDSFVPWLFSRSRKFGNNAKMRSRSRPPGRPWGGSNRFPLTSSLEKMPRSSGQKAMPARAITLEASLVSSRSSKRTEPVRFSTMPMIALSVVVLPTPLRPSNVTTSPACTLKVAPCSTWDSPYQASRLSTARSGRVSAMTGPRMTGPKMTGPKMTGPEIGFAHRRILRHRLVIALGQHVAAGEHGDAVTQIGDDAEIVLDHQHGALVGERSDQRADAGDVVVAHAGHRLVEQQHLRLERQSGGDFQKALPAIGQFDRQRIHVRREPNIGNQRRGLVV